MTDYAPDLSTARADLCRFLSACYYEPAAEFTEENLFDSLLAAATRVHPDLAAPARSLGTAFAAQDLQTLLIDYTRLFLGPIEPLAKPYESSWLFVAAPTDENPPPAVLELYARGGFDIDEDFRELPDHIAVELEFLYLLIFQTNQAVLLGDADEQAALTSLQQQFLDKHLAAWLGPFAAAVEAGAETAFYRELAAFTERFVAMEAARLPACRT
ncbi:MAG: molecular chaperone TorD family protein [Betaproteobacteria bacterium]